MSTEASIDRRAAVAVALASAAVTLAVAVTLASLLGYVHPSSRAAAAPPARADASPRTVLVPVQPESPAWRALGAEPPADARRISASADERDLRRRHEHEEHEHHRGRGERRHDD